MTLQVQCCTCGTEVKLKGTPEEMEELSKKDVLCDSCAKIFDQPLHLEVIES